MSKCIEQSHPEACHGDLHGIGGGQAWQQAPLLGDVLHYHLLPKLWPLAAVPDGNAGAHLTCIYCALCNQQPPCSVVGLADEGKHEGGKKG